jgi:hypothetical protein
VAVVNPPSWLQAGTYTAKADRLGISGLLSQPGVTSSTSMQVTQTLTPSMSILVTAGSCYIKNTFGLYQGYYSVTNDATVTIALNASHPNFGRIDLVVCHVYDGSYSGSSNYADIEVIPGDPSPAPAAPTLPDNAIILATITVPALSSSVINSRISTANRQFARLEQSIVDATRVVTSTTRPATPYISQKIYETDTEAERTYTANGWRISSPGTALPVLSTNRPSGIKAWQGLTIYEQDTKRTYQHDGSKWNYIGGGNGETLVTANNFAWTSVYTKGYGMAANFAPLTLWRDANYRLNLSGTVSNAIAFASWDQFVMYPMFSIPIQYAPVNDQILPSLAIAHGVTNLTTNIIIKGTSTTSWFPYNPGMVMWQPFISGTTFIPGGNFSIIIPPISWPSS